MVTREFWDKWGSMIIGFTLTVVLLPGALWLLSAAFNSLSYGHTYLESLHEKSDLGLRCYGCAFLGYSAGWALGHLLLQPEEEAEEEEDEWDDSDDPPSIRPRPRE